VTTQRVITLIPLGSLLGIYPTTRTKLSVGLPQGEVPSPALMQFFDRVADSIPGIETVLAGTGNNDRGYVFLVMSWNLSPADADKLTETFIETVHGQLDARSLEDQRALVYTGDPGLAVNASGVQGVIPNDL
jgi:hypothetical protein